MKKIIPIMSTIFISILSANQDGVICEKLQGQWVWSGSQWECQGLNDKAQKAFQLEVNKALQPDELKFREEQAQEIKKFKNSKGVVMCTTYLLGLNNNLKCSGDYSGEVSLYDLLKNGWHIEAEMTQLSPMAIVFTKK